MTPDRPQGPAAAKGRVTAIVVAALVALGTVIIVSTGGAGSTAAGAGPVHRTTPTTSPVVPGTYVALGDSFTSGPAIPTQLGTTTDPSAPAACLRSSENYPSLTARALGLQLVDRSCGGATTGDMDHANRPGSRPSSRPSSGRRPWSASGSAATTSDSPRLPPTASHSPPGARPGWDGAVATTTRPAVWTSWPRRSEPWVRRSPPFWRRSDSGPRGPRCSWWATRTSCPPRDRGVGPRSPSGTGTSSSSGGWSRNWMPPWHGRRRMPATASWTWPHRAGAQRLRLTGHPVGGAGAGAPRLLSAPSERHRDGRDGRGAGGGAGLHRHGLKAF